MSFVRFATVRFRDFAFSRSLVSARYCAFALSLLAAAAVALPQSDRGAIAGSVLDSSGAAVANAKITASGAETGTVYTTTSTATGAYRIPDMRVGPYNVSVTSSGFKTAEKTGVVVQINTITSLDFTLQPGDVKETLTVVASDPTLNTETSEIGTVVSTRQIIDLPLAVNASGQSHLRSPEAFVFITPGTVGPGSADSSSGTFQAKLAGGQNFGNEVILDGASTARADSGSAFDQTAPSVEALQEFNQIVRKTDAARAAGQLIFLPTAGLRTDTLHPGFV